MKHQKPSEYLHNKNMRENTLFTITPSGEQFYTLKNTRIPRKEFEQQFPLSNTINTRGDRWKGENPDGTKKWME